MTTEKNKVRQFIKSRLFHSEAMGVLIVNIIILIQAIHAVATALRIPSQRTLYAEYEDDGKEGSEWALMEGGNFIIIGISAAIGGLVVYYMSFQTVFTLMAGIQLLTSLYTLKLLKTKR